MNIKDEIQKVKDKLETLSVQYNQTENFRQQLFQEIIKHQGVLDFLKSLEETEKTNKVQ